jgi:hypothetical protein
VDVYPLALAALLGAYGVLLRHRPAVAAGALALACWVGSAGLWGYLALRKVVLGLDHMALGLAVFALAVLISLYKAGLLARWVAARQGKLPQPADGIQLPAGEWAEAPGALPSAGPMPLPGGEEDRIQ